MRKYDQRRLKIVFATHVKPSFPAANLSGSLSKSGSLDFGSKKGFPSFFVSEKGLAYIYKMAIYHFPVSYFCFATSQN